MLVRGLVPVPMPVQRLVVLLPVAERPRNPVERRLGRLAADHRSRVAGPDLVPARAACHGDVTMATPLAASVASATTSARRPDHRLRQAQHRRGYSIRCTRGPIRRALSSTLQAYSRVSHPTCTLGPDLVRSSLLARHRGGSGGAPRHSRHVERTPQLVLMAYLRRLGNGGGVIDREVGRGAQADRPRGVLVIFDCRSVAPPIEERTRLGGQEFHYDHPCTIGPISALVAVADRAICRGE